MSRQLTDTLQRILENSFLQIDKGKYKKALENLAKAEKLLEKAIMPEFLCQTLMLKGRALLDSGRQEEALSEFQEVLELSINHFLEDATNTDYQYFAYNAIGFTLKTLREMDNPSKTKESLFKNEQSFEKILTAYEELLSGKPEKTEEPQENLNFEYIMNFSKTLENVRAFFLEVRQFEKDVYFMGRIVQNYGRALEIQPDNEELFDDLDRDIRDFVRYFMIFKMPGDPKEVLEQVENVYREILGKKPGNSLAFDSLISLYEEFGDLYASKRDNKKTEESFLRALNLLEEKLQKQLGDISNIQRQSEILRSLSRALFKEETEKANKYAEKALEILKELSGKNLDDLDFQYELSDGFYELAELFGEMCDFERAEESYLLEIEICRHIHEKDPKDLESVENIAAAFDQIGHLYADEGKMEPAKHYYEQGIEINEKLLESDPGNFEYEIGIANSLNYIGELYRYPEPETARNHFEKALTINERAVKQFPESTNYREELIYTLKNLASIDTRQDQYESAIKLHKRITEIRCEMALENKGNYMSEKALGVSYSELGLLLEKAEKPELAQQQYSKAVEVFREILQSEEIDPLIKQMLTSELRMDVAFYTHLKNYYIAREYLKLIRDYYKCLFENDPESEVSWMGLYESELLDGNLQESTKNYGIAAEKYKSALQIIQKHLEADPENPEYLEKVSSAYTQLGSVYSLVDEYEKSRESFEKAIPFSAKLLEKEPEDPFYIRDIAATYEEYAKLLKKLDRDEEAEEYSRKAEALMEKRGK
jgi:tetratricopeptide (TPR) repeat protein